MTTTPRIGIQRLVSGQASAEITLNDALNLLDTFAGLTVTNQTTTTPPSSPSEGDAYIVGASATGLWDGHDDKVAVWFSGWVFVTPITGMVARDLSTDTELEYDGTGWATKPVVLPVLTNANRGGATTAGRLIFNSDDNAINVADGTSWRDASGSVT